MFRSIRIASFVLAAMCMTLLSGCGIDGGTSRKLRLNDSVAETKGFAHHENDLFRFYNASGAPKGFGVWRQGRILLYDELGAFMGYIEVE